MKILIRKRVVLVEDDPEIRAFYKLIIDSHPKFTVVGAYPNCEDAIDELRIRRPDIILMDIALTGMNGIEGARKIRDINPFIEIVIITIHEDMETVYRALKAGASGYICKHVNHFELINCLDEIALGGAPLSSKIARMIVEDFHMSTF